MADPNLQPDIPPTEPDLEDALLPEPPAWPKVVGIVSIVWASIGLMCAGCGALSPAVFFPMMQSAAKAQGQALPPTMQFGVMQWIAIATGSLLAVLLLIAGIMVVNRRPEGRVLHMVWALLAVLQGVWGLVMQIQANQAMKVWVQQNSTSPFAQGNQTVGLIIGLVIGAVMGFAWPGFCLVWFGLLKRTHESMTGGADEPAA